jgi:hypothetical protein
MGAHGHRRPLGQDAGADDERDARIFEDLALVAHAAGLRVALAVLLGEIVLGRVVGHEFAAGPEHRLGLTVDVVVVDPDRGEGESGPVGARHMVLPRGKAQRFIAEVATPRMIRRWKNMKKMNSGTSDSVDMAKSCPQAESPLLSTKARSASGTV